MESIDSDDLDGTAPSAAEDDDDDDENDTPSGSVTPSLPLKRRELAPDVGVASKKEPSPRKGKIGRASCRERV